MVGVLLVEKVDLFNPHQRLNTVRKRVHTESIYANVITYGTIHLVEGTIMKGANVK